MHSRQFQTFAEDVFVCTVLRQNLGDIRLDESGFRIIGEYIREPAGNLLHVRGPFPCAGGSSILIV